MAFITGLTDTQLRALAVPVSGTFWQATQPVSIASMPSTPVTGTFFQATQPVSGPLTDTQLRASTVPVSLTSTTVTGSVAVTGTFWQATQPVSGTFWQATQPVSLASTTITGTVAVTQATITKGTQGTTGVTTQDLKDAGRVIFAASTVIGGVTAATVEALLSLVPTRDGVAAAAATSFAITAGKRLLLQVATAGITSTAAAAISGRIALRMNPAGAVTATSPILAIIDLHSTAALAQAGDTQTIPIPDGVEFSGTHQFGLTQIGSVATGTFRVSLVGFEY